MVSSVAEIFGIETITPEYYKHALTHSSFTKEKIFHILNVTRD